MTKELKEFQKCDVFTPSNISSLMSSFLKKEGNLLEPSVGEGDLLSDVDLSAYNDIDLYEIKKHYLNKCPKANNIHKYNCDFLKVKITKKYDNIILNPPYIRIQDLEKEYITFLKKKWKILDSGNIDIYYFFLMKCLELLNDDGIMVSVTPNSFLYNKSAKSLRKFMIENRFIYKIIDYKSEKIFPNVSTYCCICIFHKKNNDKFIYNDEIISYNEIDDFNYFFQKKIILEKSLKDICIIKNGIATLRDKIFIHEYKEIDEQCWKVITNGRKDKWVIFPYDKDGKIIEENTFKKQNPKTFLYLLENKNELLKRDKGNQNYPEWYAFGRTQSLILPAQKNVIFIPTFCSPENIIIKIDKPKLFVSCLCIQAKDNIDIFEIQKIIEKNKKFIQSKSSNRGSGWINLSSRILYQIPLK